MKKILTGIITAALLLSCTVVSASAHHHRAALDQVCGGLRSGCLRPACIGQWSPPGHACVDADGDGICDNYDPEYCPGGGMGGGYVDADGDGVCDNYDPEYCPGNGAGGGYAAGSHHGRGNGSGHGRHCG